MLLFFSSISLQMIPRPIDAIQQKHFHVLLFKWKAYLNITNNGWMYSMLMAAICKNKNNWNSLETDIQTLKDCRNVTRPESFMVNLQWQFWIDSIPIKFKTPLAHRPPHKNVVKIFSKRFKYYEKVTVLTSENACKWHISILFRK